jgi:thiol-disulfide isomerase/thioredoxin
MQIRRIFFVIILSGFILLQIDSGHPGVRARIERIDVETLENLMKSQDSPNLIAVMAAWCGPCVEELPLLNKLYGKYEKKGLKLIGVTLDLEGPSAMQPIVDRLNVNFPIYWVGEKAVQAYNINALPVLFVVKEGKITERIAGKRSKKFLEEKIQELCKP